MVPSPRVVVSFLHQPPCRGIVILIIGWAFLRSSFPLHPRTVLPPSRHTPLRASMLACSGGIRILMGSWGADPSARSRETSFASSIAHVEARRDDQALPPSSLYPQYRVVAHPH